MFSECAENEICNGCTILKKRKPRYSITDYEDLENADVLFLSDSFSFRQGVYSAFGSDQLHLITSCVVSCMAESTKVEYSAAVKCPSVREADMSPDNMVLCREHLERTIDAVKPRLVFPCGNLAMKMLIRKSGITNKRGSSYEFTSKQGWNCKVVPIFHPFSVLTEPKNLYLFQLDIQNAYEKYILGKVENPFRYEVITKIEDLSLLDPFFEEAAFACDIETTGLNFLTDFIQTISFSSECGTVAIPIFHKDAGWSDSELLLVIDKIKKLMVCDADKIFHNAKFDTKFLKQAGIVVSNIWDTKIMAHLVSEDTPKGLMDLVKLHFSAELENL